MKKKIVYTDEPMQLGKKMPKDFLPPMEKLMFKEKTRKITLEVEKNSLDYLKREAKKRGGSYQRLIRNLLSAYVNRLKSI